MVRMAYGSKGHTAVTIHPTNVNLHMRSRAVVNAFLLCLICSSHNSALSEFQFIEQVHILRAILSHLHYFTYYQLGHSR